MPPGAPRTPGAGRCEANPSMHTAHASGTNNLRNCFQYPETTKEVPMSKKIVLAAATLAFFSTAAFAAEYYVVQDKTTRKCKIVETKLPATETTWVQVGPLAFKTPRKPRSRSP